MVSVIIPTVNEAATIENLIGHLQLEGIKEIIVADGGSTDLTCELAARAGAFVVPSPTKGRAAQMNYGASFATGNILYFVHADTLPPAGFVADIEKAVTNGFDVGRYETRFNSRKNILKFNAFFTRFDWFICSGGDQTLFISTVLFNTLAGFDQSMLIMEDYEIVQRARQLARYKVLPKAALVSARKYEDNNWLRVQLANSTIVRMYRKGASQQEMIVKYKNMITYR